MKKFKKFVSVALASAMVLAMAGCGSYICLLPLSAF